MTAKRAEQMRLGVFLMTAGHHSAAWRHPDTLFGNRLEHIVQVARMAYHDTFRRTPSGWKIAYRKVTLNGGNLDVGTPGAASTRN
jgi:hypothetical protein